MNGAGNPEDAQRRDEEGDKGEQVVPEVPKLTGCQGQFEGEVKDKYNPDNRS